MYRDIPTVLTADEILDKAFRRAKRVRAKEISGQVERERALSISRLNSLSDTISSTLERYVEAFPSFNRREGFFEELVDIVIGLDMLKKSLGAVQWAAGTVRKIAGRYISLISKERNRDAIVRLRKEAYGRISSVVKQVDDNLIFLAGAREKFRALPDIEADTPTVVVAGAPNVGKSMLVSRISTAAPRVASYPFTTTQIHVGFFEADHERYQVIDTPGMFDRPPSEMNQIEKQAVLALKYLAGVVVFVYDPSEASMSVEEQRSLERNLRFFLGDVPLLRVSNKIDIADPLPDTLAVSALKGDRVDDLRREIVDILRRQTPGPGNALSQSPPETF